MLVVGRDRALNRGILRRPFWICGNAEKLPIPDQTIDVYSTAFCMRNVTHLSTALEEARRVLKTGGRILCLEFSKVENETLEKIYKLYSKSIPYIGKYIAGKSEPYEYLVKSIEEFYGQEELLEIFQNNGFEKVEYRNLSGGIAAIHSGWKI